LTLSAVGLAQTPVSLRIDHKAGQADFNSDAPVVTVLGEEIEIDRLEYYLSMFTIVHDGGQETAIEGAYVLGNGFEDVAHPLGSVEGVSNVEALKFSVGIDPDNNHADPSAWPANHPLAPQVPSMHWGWSAGYRFIAMEGGAGINGVVAHEIHALGDDNHFPGEMEVLATMEDGTLVLDVEADVLGFYQDLSVAGGVINHGEDGEAVLVCNNLADRVFRTPGASNVETGFAETLDFTLTPLDGGARIRFEGPLSSRVEVELIDILGRTLDQFSIPAGTRSHDVIESHAGTFLISITGQGNRMTRRWIQG
jgi:hypothetical protein